MHSEQATPRRCSQPFNFFNSTSSLKRWCWHVFVMLMLEKPMSSSLFVLFNLKFWLKEFKQDCNFLAEIWLLQSQLDCWCLQKYLSKVPLTSQFLSNKSKKEEVENACWQGMTSKNRDSVNIILPYNIHNIYVHIIPTKKLAQLAEHPGCGEQTSPRHRLPATDTKCCPFPPSSAWMESNKHRTQNIWEC